jgi:hypothetical protein
VAVDAVRGTATRLVEAAATDPSTLDTLGSVVDVIGGLVTAGAVVVGGFWAYVKLIKGRTYRPHVEVAVDGEWLGPNGLLGLRLSITVKNIGAGKVEVLQRGSGVMVSRTADAQPAPPAETAWEPLGVYEIFVEHQWIEPGETIRDELLLRLPLDPQVVEVQTRLVLAWKPQNVSVHARRVLVPNGSGPADGSSGAGAP